LREKAGGGGSGDEERGAWRETLIVVEVCTGAYSPHEAFLTTLRSCVKLFSINSLRPAISFSRVSLFASEHLDAKGSYL
jgi:hypothetical protein